MAIPAPYSSPLRGVSGGASLMFGSMPTAYPSPSTAPHLAAAVSPTVTFCVGGQFFTTLRDTLLKEPSCRLALMARGVIPSTKDAQASMTGGGGQGFSQKVLRRVSIRTMYLSLRHFLKNCFHSHELRAPLLYKPHAKAGAPMHAPPCKLLS